jgi:hypothetical protein
MNFSFSPAPQQKYIKLPTSNYRHTKHFMLVLSYTKLDCPTANDERKAAYCSISHKDGKDFTSTSYCLHVAIHIEFCFRLP